MKVRMKFAKTGPLMYVGHLDLLRYFQKVFRRAGVDIAYSQGFSPHQITSFAAPLGLGITSEGEYLDAEFNSITTSKDMLERINAAALTPYIKVTEFVVLREGAKKAMASVAGADYYVTVPVSTLVITVASPIFTPVILPELFTLQTFVSSDVYVTS